MGGDAAQRFEDGMQANIEMHQGRSALKKIVQDFPANSPHWNEAQNRFQFVDRTAPGLPDPTTLGWVAIPRA